VIIADTHDDPRWGTIAEGAWIGSYAGVPIKLKGQVIGLLNLDSAKVQAAFQASVDWSNEMATLNAVQPD
jgi:GAF domain-containing protein